jgi:hypothetical protein
MRFSGTMPKADNHAKLFFLLPTHKQYACCLVVGGSDYFPLPTIRPDPRCGFHGSLRT